jgi:hypothetical protein
MRRCSDERLGSRCPKTTTPIGRNRCLSIGLSPNSSVRHGPAARIHRAVWLHGTDQSERRAGAASHVDSRAGRPRLAVVPVDVGNQVRRFGQQAEIKFQMTIEGLKQMGYRAIGFGPDDLRLSVGGWRL